MPNAPECGCIEDMPVVSRADCSTYSRDGLTACTNNDLRRFYTAGLGSFAGDLSFNLLGTCDNVNGPVFSDSETDGTSSGSATSSVEDATSLTENEGATTADMSPDVPEYDEDEALAALLDDTCDYNLFMCCWTQNDDQGMEDNTGGIKPKASELELRALLGY